MSTILVVDDDPRLRELVCFTLTRAGFSTREAADGQEALVMVAANPPDLLVLDVLMPELDGLSVCRELRRSGHIPIIFLSTRGEAVDRINGLELGADDYLPKPFLPAELVSRVKAVLRRAGPAEVLVSGGVRLDEGTHRVTVEVPVVVDTSSSDTSLGDTSGKVSVTTAETTLREVDLTATEFRILQALLSRPGRIVTRQQMILSAYGGAHHVSQRTLDSHVRGVRAKLQDAGAAIETVTAVGWRWRT